MTVCALAATTPGGWVFVCGPSGAGKDTLLRWVDARLAGLRGDRLANSLSRRGAAAVAPVVMAQRVITRPVHDSSPHAHCTQAEFDAQLAGGGFAMHWSAHGVHYGIASHYAAAVATGAWVVVNGSRAHVRGLLQAFEQSRPTTRAICQTQIRLVLVTAPAAVLAQRLADRGREDERDVHARLTRNADEDAAALVPDCTIVNDGEVAGAGGALLDYLLKLTASAQETSRSSGSQ
jgi:phosphonate metabolism protein PhnN/1,5-bisphosphokinase (PRPP-forming)